MNSWAVRFEAGTCSDSACWCYCHSYFEGASFPTNFLGSPLECSAGSVGLACSKMMCSLLLSSCSEPTVLERLVSPTAREVETAASLAILICFRRNSSEPAFKRRKRRVAKLFLKLSHCLPCRLALNEAAF